MQFQAKPSLSPRQIVLLLLLVSIVLMSIVTVLALKPRVTGLSFTAQDEKLWVLDSTTRSSRELAAIASVPGQWLPVGAEDILEEPDILATYRQYNAFMQRQALIYSELSGEKLFLRFADGSHAEYALQQRHLQDLPFGFYLQLFAGVLCVLIGGAIWAFNMRRIESQIYFLMGWSIALACWSSAVYTTRELAIDAEWFRLLSLINHFGAAGFGGGLGGLLAAYPCRLFRPALIWILTLGFIPVWLTDSLQLPEEIATTFHLPLLGYVVLAFLLGFAQWYASRRKAAERAILKWLMLSVVGTTMIFTVMNIIPVVLAGTTLGSQAFTLTGFALGFLMMALGLSRYKLFNLDKWWFQYWTWFFAGLAILFLDWVLLNSLQLSHGPTLGIAVALTGWLYMPVRQYVWRWLAPGTERGLQELLPGIINQLFSARNKADVHQAWRVILQDAFSPLVLVSVPAPATGTTQLSEYGQNLVVPSLANENAWQLSYPHNGSRLFSQRDIVLVSAMFALVEKAYQAIQAREEGMLAERGRIKRDLHDDLGARMLGIMHSSKLEQSQQQARQAMTDLRSILNALEQSTCSLEEASALWHAEFEERILQAGFSLDWQQVFDADAVLSARLRHNIGRVLRELVSNALRHSQGKTITIRLGLAINRLHISLQDDGTGFDPAVVSSGLGRKIAESRVAELGGAIIWKANDGGGCQVDIDMAL